MATVSHLGKFPFCIPIAEEQLPNIPGLPDSQNPLGIPEGVEVSEEWAVALYWRVKKLRLSSFSFSANLATVWSYKYDNATPVSVSCNFSGGDTENQWQRTKPIGQDDVAMDSETELVCISSAFSSTRNSTASASSSFEEGYDEDGNFFVRPVLSSGFSGAMKSASMPYAGDGFFANAVAGARSEFTGFFRRFGFTNRLVRSGFFYKEEDLNKLLFRPTSDVLTSVIYGGISIEADDWFVADAGSYVSISTMIEKPLNVSIPYLDGSPPQIYVDGGQAGNITIKIDGFEDVIVPVYTQLFAVTDQGGDLEVSTPTGSITFEATIEASEYWPYDGTYNGTTGEPT